MEPYLYVYREGVLLNTFGTNEETPAELKLSIIGYIDKLHTVSAGIVSIVHQRNSYDWCASLWKCPPGKELWLEYESHCLLTYARIRNLNFANTAFEHRVNLYMSDRTCSKLRELARLELESWDPHHTEFVPFKKVSPDGYQGVSGDFGHVLEERWAHGKHRLLVHDKFLAGRHTLELGWVEFTTQK